MYVEWAPNEKVACEVAIGSSMAGGRAMTCCKHVGLNVMADPLFTASYTGVNAGMVVVVADDPGMHSSQNEQDSRHYAVAAKLPMVEPSPIRRSARISQSSPSSCPSASTRRCSLRTCPRAWPIPRA